MLQGKKFLLTGATGGIGQSLAMSLVKQGAWVALSGTRREVLEPLQKQCGSQAFIVEQALDGPEACQHVVAQSLQKMEGLDGLIHAAGVTRDNLALRMKPEEWHKVITTNLSCAFWLSQAMLKPLLKQKAGGRIVFIGSVIGQMGNKGQCNYAATKAGLVGLAKSLAQEVAERHITVNVVAPGFITTPMTEVLPDGVKEAILQKIPLKRWGTPQDIAHSVNFLCSDHAAYITGQTLHVNGGMAMI